MVTDSSDRNLLYQTTTLYLMFFFQWVDKSTPSKIGTKNHRSKSFTSIRHVFTPIVKEMKKYIIKGETSVDYNTTVTGSPRYRYVNPPFYSFVKSVGRLTFDLGSFPTCLRSHKPFLVLIRRLTTTKDLVSFIFSQGERGLRSWKGSSGSKGDTHPGRLVPVTQTTATGSGSVRSWGRRDLWTVKFSPNPWKRVVCSPEKETWLPLL